MRSNRLLKLYLVIKPKLFQIASWLLRDSSLDISEEDLVAEAILALSRCKTTKKQPHNISYFLQRAKYQMSHYLIKEEHYHNLIIPYDYLKNQYLL